jgi:hypothetical protein
MRLLYWIVSFALVLFIAFALAAWCSVIAPGGVVPQ